MKIIKFLIRIWRKKKKATGKEEPEPQVLVFQRRRVRRYPVSADSLVRLMTVGNSFAVANGIPPGSRLVNVRFNEYNGCFDLYVHHLMFDECQMGAIVPEHNIEIKDVAHVFKGLGDLYER